jgi:uncharacterized protein GlcG (DUF336 family)
MMRAIAALLTAVACLCAAAPGRAEDALVTYKSLSPEVALEAAQAALKRCRADGYQVAVVVLDRFGQPLVLLRDRFAGLPAPEASDKAYTALSFRSDTSALVKQVQTGEVSPALGNLPHVRFLAGGVIVEAAGAVVGAVGVSGASGGDKDEACARAGVEAIRDKLDF